MSRLDVAVDCSVPTCQSWKKIDLSDFTTFQTCMVNVLPHSLGTRLKTIKVNETRL